MKFSHTNSLVTKKELDSTLNKLKPEIDLMKKALKKGYEDNHASINLPSDFSTLKKINKLIIEKRKLKPEYIVVIGIGGSNLGTIAVQEAILGQLYNQTTKGTKILYADTVDTDFLTDIISIITPVLKNGKNIILNVISKSGGTTETIANFELLVSVIKKYKKDYEKFIIVTSDENSKFYNFGENNKYSTLSIPKKVGGRYSVFSAVGLFPLGFVGINISNLLKGAKEMRNLCLKKNSPATKSAAITYLQKKKGKIICDHFLFSKDLESIGRWYRQLMGESIGKEKDINGKCVFQGITPTVSIGSTDLHSMAQLYLGGPYDKLTHFVTLEKNKNNLVLPNKKEYNELVPHIQNKPFTELMNAIEQGVKIAFKKGKRAFTEIILKNKSEKEIGALLQFKMMEMMYLGYLLNVNPFDQPNVEAYKIETKQILTKK